MDSLTLNLIMIFSFIIGTGLIILEAFIPGFGIAGISGIILELVAVWSVWKQFGMPAALTEPRRSTNDRNRKYWQQSFHGESDLTLCADDIRGQGHHECIGSM